MGEIAAFTTAVLWTLTSIFFTSASKQVGSLVVNRIRLFFAVIFLILAHLALTGQALPLAASPERWFWLALSGIVGLTLGDTLLFQSFILVGNRIGMLLMASVPVIGSLAAWLFLGETLPLQIMLGIAVCVLGIAMVILERRSPDLNGANLPTDRRAYTIGILYGLGGAIGQAGGLILAKKGLADDFSPLSATLMRMIAAMLTMWLITFIARQGKMTLRAVHGNPRVLSAILGGTVAGPFLGVWCSLIAVQSTQVGVASTLMALSPVLILPIAHWGFKEPISLRTVLWTLAALVGVALISLA